ncbi:MAG: UDP-N-acetylmuramate--L-alanine ligase [Fluviicola sp.]
MNSLENIKRFYFIGIGGIGMSALARFFFSKGYEVAGYDKTPSDLTDQLEKEGIAVHFEDLGENIPQAYKNTKETLVVYTPAIPKEMGELVYVQQYHQVLKRSEVLGLVTQESLGLGVAGTHGKTTTSTLLTHVMHQSSTKCSAFLGGISSNLNSNVLVDSSAKYTVIEADEFDRSFLRLHPFASIITAVDPDHLDIYGTEEIFREGFQEYANKHEGKLLVTQVQVQLKNTGFKQLTYGINLEADLKGENLQVQNGTFQMDVIFKNEKWLNVELGLPGIHNAENALAVITLTRELGLTEEEIRFGLKTFKGVKRRFEYHVRTEDLIYIDDYAHHPTEIHALVSSVRLLYPNKKITGVFQPHLFSRTRDFLDGFVSELAQLDEAIIMPIYPARELPIEGVTSEIIVNRIGSKARILKPEEVVSYASEFSEGVFLTIGAGDIDRIVPSLEKIFKSKS